jgi:hypothetical protein
LGLDQIPASLNGKIEFSQSSGNYTGLRWNGFLFDEHEQTLRRWAQIPEFLEAVNSLLQSLDDQEISINLPEEVPSILSGKLQISSNDIAWLGEAPNTQQREALQSLGNDASRDQGLRDAVNQLLTIIDAEAAPKSVVEVSASGIKRRSQLNDLPKLLQSQLTIEPTKVRWKGRLRSDEQSKALESLTGDAPLRNAIASIRATLSGVKEVTFTTPLPVRPQSETLPEVLQNTLLIGRAIIRYHGLIAVNEAQILQSLFSTKPDKDAIERLYSASAKKGLRDRKLMIRARRGSAVPSEMNELTSQGL